MPREYLYPINSGPLPQALDLQLIYELITLYLSEVRFLHARQSTTENIVLENIK